MRPECERCGASNRHIDALVAQVWQCSACGAKNAYTPETCTPVVEEPVCVACDAEDKECVCDAPEPAPELDDEAEFDTSLFDDIP